MLLPEAEAELRPRFNNKDILQVQVEFNWLLSQQGFIPLVYNSGDHNVLINDWYACFQVLSKQLTVWNAYLSLLGYNLCSHSPSHFAHNMIHIYISVALTTGSFRH